MRRTAIRGGFITSLLFLALTLPVGGQQVAETFLTLPIDTTISAQQGRVIELARVTTEDLSGQSCMVTASATNNSSIHPGNQLSVFSDVSSIDLVDVEDTEAAVTFIEQEFTFSDDVVVALTMGQDEEFSAGLDVSVDCSPPEAACEFDEAIVESDPNCFEPCEFDEAIPASDKDCKKPKPVVTTTEAPQPPASQSPPKGDDDLPTTGPASNTLLALGAAISGYTFTKVRQSHKYESTRK